MRHQRKAYPNVNLTGDPEKDEVNLGLLEDFILDTQEPLNSRLKALKQYMTEGLGAKNYNPTEEDLKAFAEDNMEFMSRVAKIASAVSEKPKVANVDYFKQHVESCLENCLAEIENFSGLEGEFNLDTIVGALRSKLTEAAKDTFEELGMENEGDFEASPENSVQTTIPNPEGVVPQAPAPSTIPVVSHFDPKLRPKVSYLLACTAKVQALIEAGDFDLARLESETLAHHLSGVNTLANELADKT